MNDAELIAKVERLEREVAALRRELFPSAGDQPGVEVGAGVRIDPRVRLHAGDGARIVLGDEVKLYRGCEVFGPAVLGAGTFVNRDVYMKPGVTTGVRVAIGPFTRFLTEGHEIGFRASRAGKKTTKPIVVEDGAWIGGDVTVLGGVTIGAGSVVASGSLVNRDVPRDAIVAGVPARVVRVIGGATTGRPDGASTGGAPSGRGGDEPVGGAAAPAAPARGTRGRWFGGARRSP